jgi:glycosyltransferase involved in cell wall biosynthesis
VKVLVISGTLFPLGSGGELATYLYATLLKQKGVSVKILLPSQSMHAEWNGLSINTVSTLGFGKYSLIHPSSLKKSERLIRWADIVYFTDLFYLMPFVKKMFNKPVVAHMHDYFPVCPVGSLFNIRNSSNCNYKKRQCSSCVLFYEKSHLKSNKRMLASTALNSSVGQFLPNILKFADQLVFVSKAEQALFLNNASEFPLNCSVIYNPLPNYRYLPVEGDGLGYFGGLSPLKGFQRLLKAWLKLDCDDKTRIYATKMGKLADCKLLKTAGVSAYMTLNSGQLETVFKRISCVVFPSIWQEPLPYAVSESLLRGRFLVASNVGGVSEILEDLSGCFLVKPDDVDSLTGALECVLSMSRKTLSELGLKNREILLKKFDNEKLVSQLIHVFEKAA